MIVDVGCGPNKREPADIGVDMREYDDVDIVCDIENGIPLATGSVDRILAYHVLEHVSDLPMVMAELHRLIGDGGVLEGKVPHFKDSDAYTDPTHSQYFTTQTFDYWDSSTEYGGMNYFDSEFSVANAERISRVQFWKARPIRFELRAMKT